MTRIIVSILLLTTAVALFFVKTKNYYSEVRGLMAERGSLNEALNNSRDFQKLRDGLLSKYNSISQEDIDKVNKLLPVQTDSGSLIAMIEDRVSAYNLLLKKIDISESEQDKKIAVQTGGTLTPPRESGYKSVSINFAISGSYDSFLDFLRDLERNIRLIEVKGISFSGASTDRYEFSVQAETYYLSPSASPQFKNFDENKKINAEEILAMILKLQSIKIDSNFIQSDVLKSLIDTFSRVEIPQDYGRLNPFAPLSR